MNAKIFTMVRIGSVTKALWPLAAALLFSASVIAQKPAAKPLEPIAQPIFAVLDAGKRVEPIVLVKDGKFVDIEDEKVFVSSYYKPKSTYPIIFGGAGGGALSIVKSNIGTECGGGSADTISKPATAKLSTIVMALATKLTPNDATASYRRRPTPLERSEIEKLVRAEFEKQGIAKAVAAKLRYHNLTAVDVDGDDIPEFIGSYWLAPKATDRRLLFFIADQAAGGSIAFKVNDYSAVEPDDVMSGDVTHLDRGIGHELLLDVFDFDGDGVKEVFTIGQAFEGNNYYIYKRTGGKWERVHEVYRYRCAF